MKKVIMIMMLISALLVGGIAVEAKTTKKSKSTTTQSSSRLWNGDIPSATILYSMFTNDKKYDRQFRDHGYIIIDETFKQWNKYGVCEIEIWGGSGGSFVDVIVYDPTKRNWLYNNIKNFISSHKLRHYEKVEMKGNTISFFSYQ